MKKLFYLLPALLIGTTFTLQAQRILIGTTSGEGKDNIGSIFSLDLGDNKISQEYRFDENLGSRYSGELCQATNGKFYGMALSGGANDMGVIFEYDLLTNKYTKKIDFDGVNKGNYPYGSLIQASNGKLYGMTSSGGMYSDGVLFEYDITTNGFLKKIDFNGKEKGSFPYASLYEASNGKLYGMTSSGGMNSGGVLFEYDIITNGFSKKFDFDFSTTGFSPRGSLVEANNGKLYGTTAAGGDNLDGVLFEYDLADDSYTKKVNFDGDYDGRSPVGSLVQADNGKLYGMTVTGGANDDGVLFEYDIATDLFFSKVEFDSINNGSSPFGGLAKASNGKLYGITGGGGRNGGGVLFDYDAVTSEFTKKRDLSIPSDGGNTIGGLIISSNGKLYGMNVVGGLNDAGVIFEYNYAQNIFTTKFNFSGSKGGKRPNCSLLQANDGKLYGTTIMGGSTNEGVLFEYDLITNNCTVKIHFKDTDKGIYPYSSLIQASNNKLYGMTISGGVNDDGVLFEYDIINSRYTKKVDFDSVDKGINPTGDLLQASNGKLYGMTYLGGINNWGVLFEYDINNNIFTKKVDFGDLNNGISPYGSLMQTSNGNLYGLTLGGGVNNGGVLFEYNISNNTYIKKIDLDKLSTGINPYGSLIQAQNGNLYGMTLQGGVNDKGVLFEYDITSNSCTNKIDFDGIEKGSNPNGSLLQSSNGKLYGMTTGGGENNSGVLFDYDIASNTYTKQIDFTDGARPNGSLIEIALPDASLFNQLANAIPFTLYPNPNSGTCTINSTISGTYQICNQLGQVVQRINLQQNSTATLSNLLAGIYFIKSDAGSVQQKIVVY